MVVSFPHTQQIWWFLLLQGKVKFVHAMKAYRRNRGIAPQIVNLDSKRR